MTQPEKTFPNQISEEQRILNRFFSEHDLKAKDWRINYQQYEVGYREQTGTLAKLVEMDSMEAFWLRAMRCRDAVKFLTRYEAKNLEEAMDKEETVEALLAMMIDFLWLDAYGPRETVHPKSKDA